ncbi:MAG: GGDEF domain-containing protein, partial [Pseudomonas marincola]
LGGEEFAVVLSNADTPKAAKFAERLQEELKSAPLIHDGQAIHMTVSVGIAAITPSDDKVEVSLSRSDIALYRAKRNGRDRIECYD